VEDGGLVSLQKKNNKTLLPLLPTFTPHITLLGGISIAECCTVDEDVLPQLLLLQQHQQQQRQQQEQLHCHAAVVAAAQEDDQAVEEDEKKQDEEEEDIDDDCWDEVAAKSVLKRLSNAFCNFGGIECKFVKERGVFAARRRHRHQQQQQRRKEGGSGGGSGSSVADINNNSNDNSTHDGHNEDDDEDEGEIQWNQSCISVMERTVSFTRAMELADRVLFPTTTKGQQQQQQQRTITTYNTNDQSLSMDSTTTSQQQQQQHLERHFKAPACEPHYSFVYGNDADLISSLQQQQQQLSSSLSRSSSSSSFSSRNVDDVVVLGSSSSSSNSSSTGAIKKKKKNDGFILECPPNFTSTEIAVMWTYPSTLEGVKQWREIGRFSLVMEEETEGGSVVTTLSSKY
jgi:hypothetical protein